MSFSNHYSESEAGSEYSLFEALRESIYSEVATLISQNESRPHFLIELFRELQMLSTDYLRQRALYALQDLVSKFLTEDNQSQNLDELTKVRGPHPSMRITLFDSRGGPLVCLPQSIEA